MPTLRFNSSTGSDTTGSGSNGGITANGTAASYSGSVVTLDGSPDLSGFDADEDVLWLQTSTGRQFFDLSSADDSAKTVTTVDAPAGTASGLTWGIGGKRASLFSGTDSKRLLDNGSSAGEAKPGWTLEMESGHTETLSTGFNAYAAGSTAAGPVIIKGSDGATTQPVITFTNDGLGLIVRGSRSQWKRFEIRNSNATKANSQHIAVTFASNASFCQLCEMKISHATDYFKWGVRVDFGSAKILVACCDLGYGTESGIITPSSPDQMTFVGNYIHDYTQAGINWTGTSLLGFKVLGNIFANNGADGCSIVGGGTNNRGMIVEGNIFSGNGGDGLEISGTGNFIATTLIERNIFDSNGGYGLNLSNAASTAVYLQGQALSVRRNAFRGNTSGKYNPSALLSEDETVLTADPFTDSSGGDYSLNDTAGGGAALKAVTETIGNTMLYPFGRWIAPGGGGSTVIVVEED